MVTGDGVVTGDGGGGRVGVPGVAAGTTGVGVGVSVIGTAGGLRVGVPTVPPDGPVYSSMGRSTVPPGAAPLAGSSVPDVALMSATASSSVETALCQPEGRGLGWCSPCGCELQQGLCGSGLSARELTAR